jgi:hypothetical protein
MQHSQEEIKLQFATPFIWEGMFEAGRPQKPAGYFLL